MDPKETIAQLSIKGWGGALAYCGVKKVKFLPVTNTLYLTVNGRRGYYTTMSIKLEGNDTYTVSITSAHKKTGIEDTEHTDERKDVYADELQTVFETMYDNHIKTANKGFIPLD